MYDKYTFASQLKAICNDRGLTQRDLAVKLNTTEATISRYVSGLRTPNIETTVAISQVLGASLDTLMGISSPSISPQTSDISVLISCYMKATVEQQDYIWSSVEMLGIITPEQKAAVLASRSHKKEEAV